MNALLGEAYPNCETCVIHRETSIDFPTLLIGKHWVSSIRYGDQTLLGTLFISARRHVPEVDFLTPEEELEFILVRNSLIKAVRRSFQPVTFNLSCLKNNALQFEGSGSESTHVHYHLKPRYDRTITINGETFTDPMPGHYLTDFPRNKPSPETTREIFETILSNLSVE